MCKTLPHGTSFEDEKGTQRTAESQNLVAVLEYLQRHPEWPLVKVKCQKVEILGLKRETEARQHVARLEVTVSFTC